MAQYGGQKPQFDEYGNPVSQQTGGLGTPGTTGAYPTEYGQATGTTGAAAYPAGGGQQLQQHRGQGETGVGGGQQLQEQRGHSGTDAGERHREKASGDMGGRGIGAAGYGGTGVGGGEHHGGGLGVAGERHREQQGGGLGGVQKFQQHLGHGETGVGGGQQLQPQRGLGGPLGERHREKFGGDMGGRGVGAGEHHGGAGVGGERHREQQAGAGLGGGVLHRTEEMRGDRQTQTQPQLNAAAAADAAATAAHAAGRGYLRGEREKHGEEEEGKLPGAYPRSGR